MSPTSELDLSVCICTHNPVRELLNRVLGAIAAQTLDPERWELLVVDNAGSPPLPKALDLGDSPIRVRVVREERLGLTQARLCAIRQARGHSLIFVDDDNLLAPDYLETALRLLRENGWIGALGGRCLGEFSRRVPDWARRFLPYLAVVDHGHNPIWAYHAHSYQNWFPCGAGLIIRRHLAERYADHVESDPLRIALGRRGKSLASGEDIDMVFTVMDAGYAVGYFPALKLHHVIAERRYRLNYLRELIYQAHYCSYQLLLNRRIVTRPRPWPLSYLGNLALCLMSGDWHPLTWWCAMEIARGKYAAWREFQQAEKAGVTRAESPKDLAESP